MRLIEQIAKQKRCITVIRNAFFILLTTLLFSLNNIEAYAEPVLREYSSGVAMGQIRYVSQNSNLSANGWGDYAYKAGGECGYASQSMALSYLGKDVSPEYLCYGEYSQGKWQTNYAITYDVPGIEVVSGSGARSGSDAVNTINSMLAKHIEDNNIGNYSPVVIHYRSGSTMHAIIVVSKSSDGNYIAVDPARGLNTYSFSISSSGVVSGDVTYGSSGLSIDRVEQYCLTNPVPSSYLSKCTVYPTNLTVKTTSETNLKSLPCSWNTDNNSATLAAIPVGTSFTVTELYRNEVDNWDSCWYKVSYNAQEGYIFSGNTSVTNYGSNTVTASGGTTPPSVLGVGQGYYAAWLLSSDYLNIDGVFGFIYDEIGNTLSGYPSQKTEVNAKTYQLSSEHRAEPVDAGLHFSMLEEGKYSCKISVRCLYYYGGSDGSLQTEQSWSDPVSWSFNIQNNQKNKIVFHTQGGTFGEPIASRSIDGINTGRSNGQLIVYNDPTQRVECNAYGIEVAVDSNGTVTAIRPYGDEEQLAIPNNGFILSGHLAWPTDANDGCNFLDDISIGQYVGVDYEKNIAYIFNGISDYLARFMEVYSGMQYGDLPEPVRENYRFLGWFTEEDGGIMIESTSLYSENELYAHWSPDSYTITYNANGGTNAPIAQAKTHGEPLTLSSLIPARSGYTFLGWAESADATVAAYQSGGEFVKNADTTLYAVWQKNAPDFTLPAALKEIDEEAFANCAFSYVHIPDGVTRIERRSFADCPNLRDVDIPESATSIDPTAFAGTSGLTIHGADGSYAEFYAGKFGFGFVPVA